MRVRLLPMGKEFALDPQQGVLAAALDNHINLPHSCKGGSCGACMVRLVSGEVSYPAGRPRALADEDIAAGRVLICKAQAESDLVIEVREIRHVTDIEVKSLPCRIARKALLTPDVMGVWLRLPAVESLHWQAGQYIDVMLPGDRRRSFSLANPPHDNELLELHIRRARGGEFTEQVFGGLEEGALLRIEGPLGQFVYHPGTRPLLLVGGGTGYAPLKAILRQALETESRSDVTLYRGVRTPADLYDEEWLLELAATSRRFRYFKAFSDVADDSAATRGHVHEAVVRGVAGLAGFDVYAAGPPAMINAIRYALPEHGADPARIYFDSFDWAPDSRAHGT